MKTKKSKKISPKSIKFYTTLFVGLAVVIGSLASIWSFSQQSSLDNRPEAAGGRSRLWMQESNGGTGGEVLQDFRDQFDTRTQAWQQTRRYVSVYQFHHFVFSKQDMAGADDFLQNKIIPLLNQNNMEIALNVVGANWSQCEDRDQILYREADIIDKITAAGGKVSYLSLQSTLSKGEGGSPDTLGECSPYPDSMRVDDIIRYTKFMKERYPGIQIGIMDADVTKGKDYKQSFRDLKSQLDANNVSLDYIIVDNIGVLFDRQTPADLLAMEDFVKNKLGYKFGVIYTANKNRSNSDQAYHDSVIDDLQTYLNIGGRPDIYLVTSWYEHPTQILPDNNPERFTLTRTVLDVGKILDSYKLIKINKKPTSSGQQVVSDSSVVGRLGGVTRNDTAINGWVYLQNNQAETVKVYLTFDGAAGKGEEFGPIVANQERSKVGKHGYVFTIPEEYRDGKRHTVNAYAETSQGWVQLRNSPRSFRVR